MMALTLFLPSCHHDYPRLEVASNTEPRKSRMRVSSISQTQVDTTASAQEGVPDICRKWSLTKEDSEEFFELTDELSIESYYHDFDTAPCKISGALKMDGSVWKFTINGAAKAILRSGEMVRYLGCRKPGCSSLVMWPVEEQNTEGSE